MKSWGTWCDCFFFTHKSLCFARSIGPSSASFKEETVFEGSSRSSLVAGALSTLCATSQILFVSEGKRSPKIAMLGCWLLWASRYPYQYVSLDSQTRNSENSSKCPEAARRFFACCCQRLWGGAWTGGHLGACGNKMLQWQQQNVVKCTWRMHSSRLWKRCKMRQNPWKSFDGG